MSHLLGLQAVLEDVLELSAAVRRSLPGDLAHDPEPRPPHLRAFVMILLKAAATFSDFIVATGSA